MPGAAEAPADGGERSFKVFASTSGIRIAWQPAGGGAGGLASGRAREPGGGGSGRRHHTEPSCRVTRLTPAATDGTARKGRSGGPPLLLRLGLRLTVVAKRFPQKRPLPFPRPASRAHTHTPILEAWRRGRKGGDAGEGRKENAATGGGETSL